MFVIAIIHLVINSSKPFFGVFKRRVENIALINDYNQVLEIRELWLKFCEQEVVTLMTLRHICNVK